MNPDVDAILAEKQRVLILTVGLPRSGKSTWAREHGAPVVSPDAIRLALHGQRFVASAEPFVWSIARTMVVSLFVAGHNTVILDACNVTVKRRAVWSDPRWLCSYHVFRTSIHDCRGRVIAEADLDLLAAFERMVREWQELDSLERKSEHYEFEVAGSE